MLARCWASFPDGSGEAAIAAVPEPSPPRSVDESEASLPRDTSQHALQPLHLAPCPAIPFHSVSEACP